MNEHIEGRPVSVWTYKKHGCRCDGCRTVATAYIAELRRSGRTQTHKANSYAINKAASWVRHNHPEVFKGFYAEAVEKFGVRKPGRRRRDGAA